MSARLLAAVFVLAGTLAGLLVLELVVRRIAELIVGA